MSLLDELNRSGLDRAKKQRRGRGKTLFLAQREEIALALKNGYDMKTVWKYLHENGRMPIKYEPFTVYVYQLITSRDKDKLISKENQSKIRKKAAVPINNDRKPEFNYSADFHENKKLV